MIIVEIGPGGCPLISYSQSVKDKISAGASYIGIDINYPKLLSLKKDYGNLGKVYPVVGNLFSIPLQDEIADEVWLLNVFSSNIVDKPILPNGALWPPWYTRGYSRYFTELARILKPNADLIIGEWYSRACEVNWLMESDYTSFGLSKQVYRGKAFQQLASSYGIPFDSPKGVITSFFIVLTKTVLPPTSQI